MVKKRGERDFSVFLPLNFRVWKGRGRGKEEYLHHVFEREKRGASVHRRKCERCLTVPARVKGRGQ